MANVDRRITAARLELLGSAPEIVVPRTNEVPLVFNPNWIDEIEVETSWRTDVAGSSQTNDEERTQLQSRPLRTVTATLQGMNNAETQILAQSLMAYAQKGGAAPIFCDQMEVVSSADLGDGTAEIRGDTTFRRFALGQRVAIVSSEDPVNSYGNFVQWATVKHIENDRLVLNEVPARLPTRSFLVYPCIDAEIVANATGTFEVDTVLKVRISWDETAGPETLPATHPQADFDNLKGFVSYTEENQPIFDFPPDWSDGIAVEIVREGRRTPAGLSSVLAPDGDAYHKFTLSFLADEREVMWNILRFFDAVQGRRAEFLYVNPSDPWTLWTTTPFTSSTEVNIHAVGRSSDIATYATHAIFYRPNGDTVVRKISHVIDNGQDPDLFEINLAEQLPEHPSVPTLSDYTHVRPVHLCRLDNDSMTESWKTNTVATAELTLFETHSFDDVTIAGNTESELLLATYRTKSEIVKSQPDHWYDADKNAFKNGPNNTMIRCEQWPGQNHQVHRIYDVRNQMPDVVPLDETLTGRRYLQATANTDCALMQFSFGFQNNSAATVFAPSFTISAVSDPFVPGDQRHLWTANGWTMMLCYTPFSMTAFGGGGAEASLFQIKSVGGTVLFDFVAAYAAGLNSIDLSLVKVKPTGGSEIAQFLTENGLTAFSAARSGTQTQLFVVHWDPATNRLYCHVNGKNVLKSIDYITIGDIENAQSYTSEIATDIAGFQLPDPPDPLSIARMSQNGYTENFGVRCCFNSFLSWQRKLGGVTVNKVAKELASAYGFGWLDITEY